jgi:hypothetical protein
MIDLAVHRVPGGRGSCRAVNPDEFRRASARQEPRPPDSPPKELDMTAADLMEIIRSPDFRTGLEEISSYLASIMQEGPIVHLLAKCLWKQKHLYALERNKRHDLTVWTPGLASGEKETAVEFKFNYETCAEKIKNELDGFGNNLDGIRAAVEECKGNWGVIKKIYKDIVDKEADIFVWIICSRDLTNKDAALERIPAAKPLMSCRKIHPYKTDRWFLGVIDPFLDKFQQLKRFSVTPAEIETNGDIPSTYHFRICEFAKAAEAATARQEPRPPDEESQ